jgi:hypothetical protein
MCPENLAPSEEVLRKLNSLKMSQSVLIPIRRQLKRIQWDRKHQNKDNAMVFAFLDFRDLHRYLHPFLDFTAYYSPTQFNSDQVAFEYLFKRRPLKLYMLDEYVEEYKISLQNSYIQLIEFAIKTDDEIKKRVIATNKKLFPHLKALEESLRGGAVKTAHDLPAVGKGMLDYLFDSVRAEILKKGAEEYRKMLKDGALDFARNIPNLQSGDLAVEMDQEYEKIYNRLQSLRPARQRANHTDARAFYLTQKLNKKYYDQKLFLFVTSSPMVIEAFDKIEVIDGIVDRHLLQRMDGMTVIREPEYFLLRFIFESPFGKRGVIDYELFRDSVDRFLNVVKRLESYFGAILTEAQVTDTAFQSDFKTACKIKEDLQPYIDLISQFGSYPAKAGSLYTAVSDRLDLPPMLKNASVTEEIIRQKMAKALSDPSILVEHYWKNAQLILSGLENIESGLADILFVESKTDLVYPVHISESSDSSIKKSADTIVKLLSESDKISFGKAFRELSLMRSKQPISVDTLILSSKVYRAIQRHREAIEYSKRALMKSPGSIEAVFEYALCLRRLAQEEGNWALLQKAWEHIQHAKELAPHDARVFREEAYLIWMYIQDKWFPDPPIKDALDCAIKISVDSLAMAEKTYGKESIISINIKNDLAFFLAQKGDKVNVEKAIDLIKSAISSKIPLNDRVRASFEDTQGFCLMQKYKIMQGDASAKRFLLEAAEYIRSAHQAEPDNAVRQKHLAECMKLLIEFWQNEKMD